MDETKSTATEGTEQSTTQQDHTATAASTAQTTNAAAATAADGTNAAAEKTGAAAGTEGVTDAGASADKTAQNAEQKAANAEQKSANAAQKTAPDAGVLTSRWAGAELRAAAAAAGVPAGKLAYVERMCDKAALCKDGADMSAEAAAQVTQLLKDVPELIGGAAAPAGSMGDHKAMNRSSGTADPEEAARAEFHKYL